MEHDKIYSQNIKFQRGRLSKPRVKTDYTNLNSTWNWVMERVKIQSKKKKAEYKEYWDEFGGSFSPWSNHVTYSWLFGQGQITF